MIGNFQHFLFVTTPRDETDFTVYLSGTVDGGGEVSGHLTQTIVVSATIDGGGELTGAMSTEVLPQDLAFTLDTSITDFPLNGLLLNSEAFASDTGQFTLYTEGTIGTLTITGGQGVVNMGSGTRSIIAVTGADVVVDVPDAFIEIDVVSNGTNPTGYNNIGVGIAKDGNNFLFCSLDRRNNTIRVQVKIAGSNTFLGSISHTMAIPSKIGLSIVGNSVIAWTHSAGVWTRRVTQDISSYIDLTTADMTGWKSAFTVATPNTAVWTFDNLVTSRFGAVGIRDVTLVTHEDGRPVDYSGKYRFTCSAAAPVGSHNAVYEFDPATNTIAQTAVIWTDRGGATYADLAAHIVQNDDTDGTMRYIVSSWGNGFGGVIELLHKDNVGDLTTGSHLVSGMSALNVPLIPGTDGGAYDPFLVRNGADWLLAYAVVDDTTFVGEHFYVAAATSSDMSTFTPVDDDPSREQVEGPKMVLNEGTPYITSGGRGEHPVYDTSMAYVGEPSFSPTLYNGTDTQPHIMIFPHGNEFICLTWNNSKYASLSFTWGDLQIYRADRYTT
jgi:hypothetical protein